MTYSIIGILATILLLIGNRDVLRPQDGAENAPTKKYYRRFLFGVLVYYVTDMLWGVLDENHLTKLLFADTTVYFLAMVATVVLWTHYVVSYLNRKNFFERWLLRAGQIISSLVLVFIILNFFYPLFFWFDNKGTYYAGELRYVALALQILMFIGTSAYTLYTALKTEGVTRQRHLTIGLFGLAMMVFLGFQTFFPLWPFYAMGYMLGISFLHSYVLEDEKEEYRHKLEISREALKEALETAEKANKAKTIFLSKMSHEIRTPMNAIIGLNSIALNDTSIPQSTRTHLEKIGASAQHLLGIINDILDISRIDSGSMTLKNEEFSLTKILEQVNYIIQGQCESKDILFHYEVQEGATGNYIGDETKLRQILINILGNSVKFTPEGGCVKMVVDNESVGTKKSALRFVIEDTGIGIGSDFLPHIFETFAQEDESFSSKYGSTGLGLPITKSIVELMDGHIDVESEKGLGSKFTVTVMLQKSAREESEQGELDTPKDNAVKKPKANLEGRRILLAEDVSVNAEITTMVLSMRKMKVERAENGRIAVNMFRDHNPGYYDAILMDIRMPEMDGLQATATIRAMDRLDARSIPIIALTANAFDEDVQNSLQAGLNAHLSKPIEAEALYQTLEELL